MRATLQLLSKASRAPLTSKQGNKNYYKGTGSHPGLGSKRTGRHAVGKAPYIMMPERMRRFVVPEGLNETDLKPYVAANVRFDFKNDSGWPMANSKPTFASKRQGLFGPNGFDGHYYLQLGEHFKGIKSE
ncbi:RHTO0S10e00342g1_1 [Rhodotorula toruloides]|nr:RHTO0S10e00342g1_1 [Rhodotorula toruloides]